MIGRLLRENEEGYLGREANLGHTQTALLDTSSDMGAPNLQVAFTRFVHGTPPVNNFHNIQQQQFL